MGLAERIQVWSCGGGTQSAAIGALICTGQLERPDIAVMVDTERECSSTWDYFDRVLHPKLMEAGVDIKRINKSDYATVDLWGGEDGKTLELPAFTTQEGSVSKLPTFCSGEWKTRVVQRYCNEVFPDARGFDQWIGISRDEPERMRFQKGKWEYKHPLIDDKRLMSRQDCISLVISLGWGRPPRSRCWMCPNQLQAEWNDLKANAPEDFAKAIAIDHDIRAIDKFAFLHQSGKPLSEMPEDQPDLFGSTCMGGLCFV